jgi:hypothetical protein
MKCKMAAVLGAKTVEVKSLASKTKSRCLSKVNLPQVAVIIQSTKKLQLPVETGSKHQNPVYDEPSDSDNGDAASVTTTSTDTRAMDSGNDVDTSTGTCTYADSDVETDDSTGTGIDISASTNAGDEYKYNFGDFVVVEYPVGKLLKHYIGKITAKGANKSLMEVSFLGQTQMFKQFRFPHAEDVSVIDEAQIITVLAKPEILRRGLMQFKDIDFVVRRYLHTA